MEGFTKVLIAVLIGIGHNGKVSGMRLPPGSDFLALNATDGMEIIGDMIIPKELHNYLNTLDVLRKVIGHPDYRWPEENGLPTVPYRISDSASGYTEIIMEGIKHWEEHTCITFRNIQANDESYIDFIKDIGCWSYVGRISNTYPQEISIGNGCQYLGTVVHEIGHAMGFIHEQMRPDRDDFLHINLDNVDPGNYGQFSKYSSSDYFTYSVGYDYLSVMQYAGMDFSSNGKLTMATKEAEYQGLLGRGQVLSHRDKLAINIHYGCIDKWEESCQVAKNSCQNDGYMGKECSCICPPGTTGQNCELKIGEYHDSEIPSCSTKITEETTISSPYYPSQIPLDTWCVYQIQAPEGMFVKITFEEFSLEKYTDSGYLRCATAFLEIRNTDESYGNIFCGSDFGSQESIESTSRDMILYLDTPYSYQSRGFKAQVSFVSQEAPTESQQTVSVTPSGGGAAKLPPYTKCQCIFVLFSILYGFFKY